MLAALATRHRAMVAIVNQVGANDSLIFDGSSFAVNAGGEVIAQAGDLRALPAPFAAVEADELSAESLGEVGHGVRKIREEG